MKRRAIAVVKLLVRKKPTRPILRSARGDAYGFCRQLAFSAVCDLVDQVVGWDEYRMDMHFARQWNLSEVSIVTLNGRDIGWMQRRPDREATSLLNLFLLPAYRGRGIGATILQQVLAQAGKRGKAVTLSVMKRNRALGFYQRHGFVVTQEGSHEFTMRCEPRRSARGVGPSMGLRRG
jgi:ribosomal protein S18 acetylase RimI-like enzyme